MSSKLRTFEQENVPYMLRQEAAARNLLLLWASAAEAEVGPLVERIRRSHPWFASFEKSHRARLRSELSKIACLPYVTTGLPGGCPLACKGCGSGQELAKWRRKPEHIPFAEMRRFLTFLRLHAGLGMVRITGEGEPTQADDYPELVMWGQEHEVNLVVCTNGMSLSPRALDLYRRVKQIHLYVKHLGGEKVQAEITDGYNQRGEPIVRFAMNETLGFLVPEVFNTLHAIDPRRVGFRATIYRENVTEIRALLAQPKLSSVPTFVGAIEEIGDAVGRGMVPVGHGCAETSFLTAPSWPLASVAISPEGRIMQGRDNGRMLAPGVSIVGNAPEDIIRELFRKDGEYAVNTVLQPKILLPL